MDIGDYRLTGKNRLVLTFTDMGELLARRASAEVLEFDFKIEGDTMTFLSSNGATVSFELKRVE